MNALMMPALRAKSFGFRGNAAFDHVAAGQDVLKFRSGRLALADALQRSGVGPDHEVLVPAYHCQSIVEPIEALGARPVYYRVLPDLRPDCSDLERKCTRKTKSVIAVHIFGIEANLSALRSICDHVGATLIEDCAHCFSYSKAAPKYALTGDFVVTSPRKFLPIFDGGELFSAGRTLLSFKQSPINIRYQLKIALNILERGWVNYRRYKQYANAKNERRPSATSENENPSTIGGAHAAANYKDPRFDFTNTDLQQSIPSRILSRSISFTRVEQNRVRNFARLEAASRSLRLAVPAFSNLISTATPYVFPLVLEGDGDLLHARLKQAGVPMWRWDDLRESDCKVSREYRKSLIQLPCHQELTPASMDRIIFSMQEILG